jgi:hypothetical protein
MTSDQTICDLLRQLEDKAISGSGSHKIILTTNQLRSMQKNYNTILQQVAKSVQQPAGDKAVGQRQRPPEDHSRLDKKDIQIAFRLP